MSRHAPTVDQSVDAQFVVDAAEASAQAMAEEARINAYVAHHERKRHWVDANRNGFTNATGFCSEDSV